MHKLTWDTGRVNGFFTLLLPFFRLTAEAGAGLKTGHRFFHIGVNFSAPAKGWHFSLNPCPLAGEVQKLDELRPQPPVFCGQIAPCDKTPLPRRRRPRTMPAMPKIRAEKCKGAREIRSRAHKI
ncbi:MAG: hypothetical protein AB7U46_06415 [Paenirhodobacter sp.]